MTAAILAVEAGADTRFWLDDVPDYDWYNGCSPTAGGQLVGYWDRRPGYENLWDGTAPLTASHSHDIYDMIASPEHIDTGTYPYNGDACTHPGAPNSLSCFMHTEPTEGASYSWNIASGMSGFAAWDDPNTTIDESSHFNSFLYATPHAGWSEQERAGAFQYRDLVREIDAGNPLLLNVSLDGGGHSVTAYGYRIDDSGDRWFAVRDTWQNGDSNGYKGIVSEVVDGHEWWRYDLQQTEGSAGNAYYVSNAIPFSPNVDGPITEDTDFGDDNLSAFSLTSNVETIYAALSTSDQDWYRIWLDANDRIGFGTFDYEGRSGAIDTEIHLFDGSGTWLDASDNLSSLTNTSNLHWRASSSDWYYLAVTAGGNADVPQTGDYTLVAYRSPVPEPGTIVLVSLGLAGLVARRRRGRRG
jgi:hypothetical protein